MKVRMGAQSQIAVIVLAAGGSARLGTAKQLLEYNGSTLLRRAVDTSLASMCRQVVVVLGGEADRCRAELSGLPVTIVENGDWQNGIGTSIRVGVDALPDDTHAVILMVCDQPLLNAEHVDRLVKAHLDGGSPIVASAYGGTVGVPALFDSRFFKQLRALDAAEGAKILLRRHADLVVTVDFPGGETDVDTAEDYDSITRSSTVH